MLLEELGGDGGQPIKRFKPNDADMTCLPADGESAAYSEVSRMCILMEKFIREHPATDLSDRTVFFVNSITGCQIPIGINQNQPLTIADLEYFGVTGHAFSISHASTYVVPLSFDIDCLDCKANTCDIRTPIQADNPWLSELCAILSARFEQTIDNESGPITYQVFVRDGTCSFHVYFSISVGLFLQQSLYSLITQNMPIEFTRKYLVDRVFHMPLPYSAKRDFDVYHPILSKDLNKSIYIIPSTPFFDVPLRFTHSNDIEGKTVLLLKNFLFSEQELSFIKNTNLKATNAVSSRVIMMEGALVRICRNAPTIFAQLREKSFIVESFGNPVAEEFFKEFVSQHRVLQCHDSVAVEHNVKFLGLLCSTQPEIIYTMRNFFNLMTLLSKLYYPINLSNLVEIPNTPIIVPVNIFQMIRHWFTFDSQHYLILQIMSTVQRLKLVEFDQCAKTVSDSVMNILRGILNLDELTDVGRYIFENIQNTSWETNFNSELLQLATPELIFYIGHEAANDFANLQNKTNHPVTEEFIFTFLRNHYQLMDARMLQKPLMYYFTVHEPIILVDHRYMLYCKKDGIYKPTSEKALNTHISNLTKRLLAYACISDKIGNDVLENIAKTIIRAVPTRVCNQYHQVGNSSMGLIFFALGIYQKHVPAAYFTTQRLYMTRHVDLSITENLLEHSNMYFVKQREMLNRIFEAMMANANRFMFLETFIPSILHLPYHAYIEPTILMACFSQYFKGGQFQLLDFLSIFLYFKIPTCALQHVLTLCHSVEVGPLTYGNVIGIMKSNPMEHHTAESYRFLLQSPDEIDQLQEQINQLGVSEERLIYFYCLLIIDRFASKPTSRVVCHRLLGDDTVQLETLNVESLISSIPDHPCYTYTKRALNVLEQHHQTCDMGCIALAEIMGEKVDALDSATIQLIRNTLISLGFSTKAFRDLMYDFTGLCQPGNSRKKIIVLHGESGSGKTYLVNLLANAAGASHHNLTSALTSKDGVGGMNPQLIAMCVALVIYIAELQYIDESLLKAITGGDSLNRRPLHRNEAILITFIGFFVSTTNQFPRVKGDNTIANNAIANRHEFYGFENKYVEEPSLETINSFIHLAKHEQVIKYKNKTRDAVTLHNLVTTIFTFHVQRNGEFKPIILNYQGYMLKYQFKAANCERYALMLKKNLHFLDGLEINRSEFHQLFAGEKWEIVEGIENLLVKDNCLMPGVYQHVGVISAKELENLFGQLPMFTLVPCDSDLTQDMLTKLIYKVGDFHKTVTIRHQINLFKNHPSFDGTRLRYVNHNIASKLLLYGCPLPPEEANLESIREHIRLWFKKKNLDYQDLAVDGELVVLAHFKYLDENRLSDRNSNSYPNASPLLAIEN